MTEDHGTGRPPKGGPARDATTLVLLTCPPEMFQDGGFLWPRDLDVDGSGLRGLRWGEGDGRLLGAFSPHQTQGVWSDAFWLVAEVPTQDLAAEADGSVRFKTGRLHYAGDRESAGAYINGWPHEKGESRSVVGAEVRLKNDGTAIVGDGGVAESGDGGTSKSGRWATSVSGKRGTSISGDGGWSASQDLGTAITGDGGTAESGDGGTSESGRGGTSRSMRGGYARSAEYGNSWSADHGHSVSGDCGASVSGAHGISQSGAFGMSIAGEGGAAQAGPGGWAAAGLNGTIAVLVDDNSDVCRHAVVDGKTIKPGTAYSLGPTGEFVDLGPAAKAPRPDPARHLRTQPAHIEGGHRPAAPPRDTVPPPPPPPPPPPGAGPARPDLVSRLDAMSASPAPASTGPPSVSR